MTTYRKTATVEAVQWTGDNPDKMFDFLGDDLLTCRDGVLAVNTLEGTLEYEVGYWIVRNPAGEHYGCADDVWQTTYVEHDPDSVEDEASINELDVISDGLLRALDLLDSCSTEYRVFEELATRLEKALG